jgi:anti-anti-sigma factor
MLSSVNPGEIASMIDEFLSKGKSKFIFDLKKVLIINSIGIGILMASWTTITNAQGHLALTGLSEKVAEILSISETDQIIPVFDSISEAEIGLNLKSS